MSVIVSDTHCLITPENGMKSSTETRLGEVGLVFECLILDVIIIE